MKHTSNKLNGVGHKGRPESVGVFTIKDDLVGIEGGTTRTVSVGLVVALFWLVADPHSFLAMVGTPIIEDFLLFSINLLLNYLLTKIISFRLLELPVLVF